MVYADYNATTPVLPEVLKLIQEIETSTWGNASSIHSYGRQARAYVEKARETVARELGAQQSMVLFTSGGSESNNWVLRCASGGCESMTDVSGTGKRHLVISAVEHPSILYPAKRLAERGEAVTLVPVDANGALDMQVLKDVLKRGATLVSVMHANNETGNVYPIAEVVKLAKEAGALVHCDASQAVGKLPLNFMDLGCDFMTVSAHKFYGPKGVGALLVRQRRHLEKMNFGGGQEFGMRPGTENVSGISGMAEALRQLKSPQYAEKLQGIKTVRDHFEQRLRQMLDGLRVNAVAETRLPNTSNICFAGMDAQSILMNLDLKQIACSSGSACHSGSVEPSHVLAAMGYGATDAATCLRFSFGLHSTAAEADRIVEVVVGCVKRLRDSRH